MGQRFLVGPDHETTARALEALTPGDIVGLGPGRMRYTMLLNDDGGMVDDLMVTRAGSAEDDGTLGLVFNGARKDVDDAFVRARLPANVKLVAADDRALLALQGPAAEAVLARHCPKAAALSFMAATSAEFDGIDCAISRSGYTGEDGYEISVAAKDAEKRRPRAARRTRSAAHRAWRARFAAPRSRALPLWPRHRRDHRSRSKPISPGPSASAARWKRIFRPPKRSWTSSSTARRASASASAPKAGRPRAKAPRSPTRSGRVIGRVTSGGFGPTLNAPVAMGYVETAFAADGTELDLMVRGKPMPARVAPMPFVPHRYKR